MHELSERMRRMVAEQAADWYVENRASPLDARQKRAFMRWLRASPTHVSEYLAIAGVAHDAQKVSAEDVISMEELLAPLARSGNVTQLPAARVTNSLDRKTSRSRLFGAPALLSAASAAMVAIVLAIGWVLHDTDEQRFVTRAGEERTFTLADDTVIHMNTNATLVVRFDEHRRLVELKEGEVAFTVGAEEQRPFQVLVGKAVLEDLGTAFNVLRDERQTVVTVMDGEVGIWNAANLDDVTGARLFNDSSAPVLARLRAGDQATVGKSGDVVATGPADIRKTTAWLRGEIVFDGDTLAAVVEQFNRYNRIKMRVVDARIGAMPIAGVFNSRDVTSFAQFVDGLPGVSAVQRGEEIVIRADEAARR